MNGLFFIKKVVITKHAYEQYKNRIGDKANSNSITANKNLTNEVIRKAILADFKMKNVQRKSPKDKDGIFKVWCKGSREYVCLETEKTIKVITFINKTLDGKGRY